MKVSVIITTHAWDRFGDLRDAIRSIERQTYDDVELVLPFDRDQDMPDAAAALADGGSDVTTTYEPDSEGMAATRNAGAAAASGDIYAFTDDDCVASPEWVARLVDAFEEGAVLAGGPALPQWPDGDRPAHIPRRWDWLVGCGPYHDEARTVRNTYGCNLAVRGDVFKAVGGFDESYGKAADLGQGEEAEFARRVEAETGQRCHFVPEAVVHHRVEPAQLRVAHLLRRCWAQGRCKARLGLDEAERGFLRSVLADCRDPRRALPTLAFTAATGLGYLTHNP